MKTYRCFVCGKEGCDKCLKKLLSFEYPTVKLGDLWVCSDACSGAFLKTLMHAVPASAITLADYPSDSPHPERYPCPSSELFDDAVMKIVWETNEEFAKEITRYNALILVHSDIKEQLKRYCDLYQAKNLERAGRREEAAKIFDQYSMYDEARKLRDKEKQVVVRRTDVTVDLNALLKEVKDGGIVVVYRCPNCGGKLKVGKDTRVESLKVCEHCGSEIEALDLADFLKTALS